MPSAFVGIVRSLIDENASHMTFDFAQDSSDVFRPRILGVMKTGGDGIMVQRAILKGFHAGINRSQPRRRIARAV